jgi:hypothetical protein
MSNLYHKFAVASVGIALGFALEANKEAKAATFTLRDYGFLVADTNLDGLGDWYYGGVPLPVGIRRGESFSGTEYRAFYQFNIAQLSLASNTVISSAIFNNIAILNDFLCISVLMNFGEIKFMFLREKLKQKFDNFKRST